MSNLQYFRKQKNLTQNELSELTGISIKTIRAYEQGYLCLEYASYHNVIQIAKVLGVNPSTLTEGDNT